MFLCYFCTGDAKCNYFLSPPADEHAFIPPLGDNSQNAMFNL